MRDNDNIKENMVEKTSFSLRFKKIEPTSKFNKTKQLQITFITHIALHTVLQLLIIRAMAFIIISATSDDDSQTQTPK